MPKKYLLTLISISCIILFFSAGFYAQWLDRKVLQPLAEIPHQMNKMTTEDRLATRLKKSYGTSQAMLEELRSKGHADSAIVLLPPQGYLKAQGIDFPVPEPAVFYYYTGLKSKWISSPDLEEATHAALVVDDSLKLVQLTPRTLENIITLYEPYKTK
jgi:hypothetical protein